jgi:clan AA aspartic protease
MGLTRITLYVANPARPKKSLPVEFLVDSGAVYSVVPAAILRKLNVKAHSKEIFTLADGSHITRRKGDLLFRLNGKKGASPVIFGERGDSVLLGAVTLEALGVILDPIKRQLKPMPMILVGVNAEPYRAV